MAKKRDPSAEDFAELLEKLSHFAAAFALMNRQELAKALNCGLRSIDKLQKQGMPCVFIGKSRRFVLPEVLSWLKRRGRTQ